MEIMNKKAQAAEKAHPVLYFLPSVMRRLDTAGFLR